MTALDASRLRDGAECAVARSRGALILDLDPDLGSGLNDLEFEQARRTCRANVIHLSPGSWALPCKSPGDREVFAVVITEGILSRETVLAGRATLELLTAGDVLLPSTISRDLLPLGADVSLTVLSKLTAIALGPSFLQSATQWPCLMANLHHRLNEQQTRATIQGLVLHLARAEHRILLTLWLLAERCGRVTREGRLLPLGFTHEALSRITAARRPTVSLALKQLQSDGLLIMRPDGNAVLTPAAEQEIHNLADAHTGLSIGQCITLRPRRAPADHVADNRAGQARAAIA